ncbi:LOW QUALITY PROTEIN: hypothetical protein HID58_046109, partial [Brassica napus]
SDILVPCCVVVSYGVKLHLIGLGQSLVVIDVVFLVVGLPSIVSARLDLVFGDLTSMLFFHNSRMDPRFVDFILSLFISLFSHLVASFIADHVSGGSPFRHICYSRLFMVSSLSFGFSVVGFHSPTLGVLWFFAVMGAL